MSNINQIMILGKAMNKAEKNSKKNKSVPKLTPEQLRAKFYVVR
jgi:hypothetical protein